MILKSDIELAFANQQASLQKNTSLLITREYIAHIDTANSHIEIVSGIRRCGKSTLLFQILLHSYHNVAFFNFEEPQVFGFEKTDFPKLYDVMGEDRDAYFFDEIQAIEGWEIFIRSLHDKGKKIFITGSNASMLSKELGTRLTGRYIQHELFPFSYLEYLDYKRLNNHLESFREYLSEGGFPEFISQNRPEILHQLFRDILYRDIAIRHGLRHSYQLEQICLFLLSNVAKETSFNSLRKLLNIASTTTVSDFVGWLQDSYLLFLVPRFSYSVKTMMVNPKKVYAIDTGLVKKNSLSRTEDFGRLLENIVYLHLRRKKGAIYYFKEKNECDFIVLNKSKFEVAIQVCADINTDNKERELNGILEALQFFNAECGTIVTLDQEDKLIIDGKTVNLIPVWKYLTQ
jgi:uncharacterized protein